MKGVCLECEFCWFCSVFEFYSHKLDVFITMTWLDLMSKNGSQKGRSKGEMMSLIVLDSWGVAGGS